MKKKIFVAFVAVILLLAGFVASRPSEYAVERSASVAAPADIVFGLINDLGRWTEWSPWDKLDPNQTRTYEGPAAGKGAIFSWKGDDKVGEGRITITDSRPNQEIAIRLEFLAPWKSTNAISFQLSPEGGATKVVWRMEGKSDFVGKAFSLFMDMDAMVGKDFETGLRSLGEVAVVAAERRAEEEARRAAAAAEAMAEQDADGEGAAAE